MNINMAVCEYKTILLQMAVNKKINNHFVGVAGCQSIATNITESVIYIISFSRGYLLVHKWKNDIVTVTLRYNYKQIL